MPSVAELNFFSAGSEIFLGKMEKLYEMPDNAISITTIKTTTFVMTLFNSTYI